MNRRLTLAAALAGAALAISSFGGAARAAGTNIVPNGDFSNGFDNWQFTPATKAEVDGGHGMVANVFDELFEDSIATIYQCIPVSDSKNYHLFGAVYIPSGQERSGYARLVTTFYPTNNCGGVALDVHQSTPFHDQGAWLTDSSDLVRANPKAAYSLKVALIVKKDSTDKAAKQHKAFYALFDNIKVMETGKPAANPGGGCLCQATDDEPPAPPKKTPVAPAATPTPGEPKVIPPTVQPGGSEQPAPTVAAGDSAAGPNEPSTSDEGPFADPVLDGVAPDGDIEGDDTPALPALEPASQGTPTAATQTPEVPATGGDSSQDRPYELDGAPQVPAVAGQFNLPAEDAQGLPFGFVAGVLLALVAGGVVLALGLRRLNRA